MTIKEYVEKGHIQRLHPSKDICFENSDKYRKKVVVLSVKCKSLWDNEEKVRDIVGVIKNFEGDIIHQLLDARFKSSSNYGKYGYFHYNGCLSFTVLPTVIGTEIEDLPFIAHTVWLKGAADASHFDIDHFIPMSGALFNEFVNNNYEYYEKKSEILRYHNEVNERYTPPVKYFDTPQDMLRCNPPQYIGDMMRKFGWIS